jgi:hypothetical protein
LRVGPSDDRQTEALFDIQWDRYAKVEPHCEHLLPEVVRASCEGERPTIRRLDRVEVVRPVGEKFEPVAIHVDHP